MGKIKEVEERTFCVYKHTSPHGKIYIGITSMKPPEKRWKNGHGYGHNLHFTHAIEKYGWNNFEHEIIQEGLNEEDAQKLEKELIEKYETFDSDKGYNRTTGGEIGKQHTEEVRRNQSELAKKMWEDEEYRKKMIEFLKSRTGEKNSNYGNHKLAGENHPNYGKKLKPETIEKIRQASLNMSEETKKKISDAAKARMTPEYREKMRQARLGTKMSDEAKAKMSQSQKDRWTDETRKDWSEKFSGENNGMYGKHHSEETKQKLREMFSGENSVWYGKHHTEESKKKAHDACTWKVPVVQLDLDGNFVAEYDSASYGAKAVGKDASCIIECYNGKAKSAYGFIWVKKEAYYDGMQIRYENKSLKPVIKLTQRWEFIDEYESVTLAAKSEGAFGQNVGRSCKSKGEALCKELRWMYKEDYLKLKGE